MMALYDNHAILAIDLRDKVDNDKQQERLVRGTVFDFRRLVGAVDIEAKGGEAFM